LLELRLQNELGLGIQENGQINSGGFTSDF